MNSLLQNESLPKLVAALPEVYQPIYGHAELSTDVSRASDDRLAILDKIVHDLKTHYQRPLKILDLGCAQGNFALSLAPYCERVLGVDMLDKNIAVCEALAREQGMDHVSFRHTSLQEIVRGLQAGEFDIVIALSVFHHICHSDGLIAAQALIGKLSENVDVLLLELAIKEEPLYWAASLPEDPKTFLQDLPFVRTVGEFPTHLSEIKRPLFFASQHLWHFDRSTERFLDWTSEAHEYARGTHQGTRRYFKGNDKFAKTWQFEGYLREINLEEFDREIAMIRELACLDLKTVSCPTVHDTGKSDTNAYLVTDLIPGHRLSEIIERKERYDAIGVILSVLQQLAELETHGMYHADVRVWNVLLDVDGRARLIDFGSILKTAADVAWPHDAFASFLIFVVEVCKGVEPRILPFRTPFFSPAWADKELHSWFNSVWEMPRSEWTFRKFKKLLKETLKGELPLSCQYTPPLPVENLVYWMSLIENLAFEATNALPYAKAEERRQIAEAKFAQSRQLLTAREAGLAQSQQLLAVKEAEFVQSQQLLAAKEAEFVQSQQLLAAKEAEFVMSQQLLAAKEAEFVQSQQLLAAKEAEFVMSQQLLAAKEAEFAISQQLLTAKEAEVTQLHQLVSEVQLRLSAVYASSSWRGTGVFRMISRWFRRG